MMIRTGVMGVIGSMIVMLAFGCAPRAELGQKEFHAPKPPPPVPPRRDLPLDAALREQAKAQVREAFESSDPELRANAVEAAQDTLGIGAHDLIGQGLSDGDPLVRFASAMAVGKLRLQDFHDGVWALAHDPDVKTRIGALYALHRLGDTRLSHELEKTAVDPNPRVREDTAFVLGLLGEKSAIKILQHMTRDEDTGVRIAVAEAMWRLGDERGLDVLVAGTVGWFADDRMLCLLGLVAPRDKRVEEHVRGKLTDEWDEVALVAARALGDLGSDGGYGVAQKYIKDPDPRRRALAAVALGAIGRSDAQELLAPLLKDAEPHVRLAAAAAILKLKESK